MKTKLMPACLPAAAMIVFLFVLQPALLHAGGPLTPPGAPAPTMKSLQEIEPRTLIASLPYTITNSGSYYLSNSLTVTTGDAITILTNGVTLDLDGFTITSSAGAATGHGIYIPGAVRDITIINGGIEGGVKDNGNGTFTGGGFAYGISATNATSVRLTHVSVSGCLVDAIHLNFFGATIAEKCTVFTIGNYGIYANTVDGCSASDCGQLGVLAADAANSYGQSPYNGQGFAAYNAVNCYGVSSNNVGLNCNNGQNCIGTSSSGTGLSAILANNCTGSSSTTNNEGISAYTANGCYGSGGFAGLYCYNNAIGCIGSSSYGYGIYAPVANNCYGYSYIFAAGTNSWAGISASVAENCYGYSYNNNSGSFNNYGIQADVIHNCEGFGYYGYGIYSYNNNNPGAGVVENSYGQSYNASGIYARMANNCSGYSTNGTGMFVSYAANNCTGQSLNSDGLDSYGTVNNCYGFTDNGYYGIYCEDTVNNSIGTVLFGTSSGAIGIYAYASANNCNGYSPASGGYGLLTYEIATGCLGNDNAAGAVGIHAYVANSCVGISSAGTPEQVTYKYNMP